MSDVHQSNVSSSVGPSADLADSAYSSNIPHWILDKWQEIVDTMAELVGVPAGLIMQIAGADIKCLVSSRTAGNPYHSGDSEHLFGSGLYCETVINSRDHLLVPNALTDQHWKSNPDVKLNMISYLGFPLFWPDAKPFGTICVLDSKANSYADVYKRLITQFGDIIEHHLELIYADSERQRSVAIERRRGAEALLLSEQRFRLLAEHAADDFLLHNEEGRILDVNHRACQNMGRSRDELLGMVIGDLPFRFKQAWNAEIWRRAQPGYTTTIHSDYAHASGKIVSAEIRWTCQCVQGQKLFLGLVRDITERIEAEKALREIATSLAEGQRISCTGNWRWNVASGEVRGSVEYLRILDVDPTLEQFSYFKYMERVHPEDRPSVERVLGEASRHGTEFKHENRIILRDGSIRYVQSTGHPLRAESDALEFMGIVMDVTERRRAEETLRLAQAELARVSRLSTMGEFAGSIAHEINQPLAAIVMNAETCLCWLSGDEPNLVKARDAVSRLARDGRRAADVVAGIRALVRRSNLNLTKVDINDAIREVLALFRGDTEGGGIVLHVNLFAGDSVVMADRVQLQQVLLNLLRNGVEAMSTVTDRPRALRVSSEAADQGKMVLVSIEDTGDGLDPATANRIFDPLFTTKANGMGMGLSICRSIVEGHRGSLWASPSRPNGTVFRFTVPRANNASD